MVIDGIKKYLESCPLIDGASVGVDFLGSDAYEYTVEIMPESGTVRQYTDGECIKQVGFVFASRNFYGADNTKNIEFYEKFSLWLEECSENGTLPELGDKLEAIGIEAESSGYMYDSAKNTARYQIQCRLIYHKSAD